MLNDQISDYHIILASGSPRRQQFLKELELNFEIQLKPVDEVYPTNLQGAEITDFLAQLKAEAFKNDLKPMDIVITSDTIVWHNNTALGKPTSVAEAEKMIASYCDCWHDVISSVCFTTSTQQITQNFTTRVHFKKLTAKEISHYVATYKPMDKAGAYGIQEWIGLIGIDAIEGSYFNVVGLPTHIVYETLMILTKS